MPGGQPTKYGATALEVSRNYLNNYRSYPDTMVPSITGLALLLGVHRDTVYAWAKVEGRDEFSDILKNIMQKQREALVTGGLNGSFNPTITKLMLTKHGYSDKNDVNVGGPDGKPFSLKVEIVDTKE